MIHYDAQVIFAFSSELFVLTVLAFKLFPAFTSKHNQLSTFQI